MRTHTRELDNSLIGRRNCLHQAIVRIKCILGGMNLPPHLPELSKNSFEHVLHVTTPVVAWAVQEEQCVGHSAITIS